jgi:hypothetical protein
LWWAGVSRLRHRQGYRTFQALKEAIYDGDWSKLDSEGKVLAFSSYKAGLVHWASNVREFVKLGIAMPLSRSHDTRDDPEQTLGQVIGAEVKANAKGIPSLYLTIDFDGQRDRDIAIEGDVSIGSPPV